MNSLKERIEKTLGEIALPRLNEDVFSAEYTSEIGHGTPDGFYVDNLPPLVRTHEEIMTAYREKLHSFAENIRSML